MSSYFSASYKIFMATSLLALSSLSFAANIFPANTLDYYGTGNDGDNSTGLQLKSDCSHVEANQNHPRQLKLQQQNLNDQKPLAFSKGSMSKATVMNDSSSPNQAQYLQHSDM